jgi:ribosomal protein L7/L12
MSLKMMHFLQKARLLTTLLLARLQKKMSSKREVKEKEVAAAKQQAKMTQAQVHEAAKWRVTCDV